MSDGKRCKGLKKSGLRCLKNANFNGYCIDHFHLCNTGSRAKSVYFARSRVGDGDDEL